MALLPAALVLSSCIAVSRPIFKIGLVAPFEGRYRSVGYEVIYAVRLAVREANAAGGVAGYSVELVALDDGGDPAQAAEQARKMAVDPQIVGVIGDWLNATTQAAAPEYARAGLPFLATAAGPLPPESFRLWPAGACQLNTSLGCVEALEDLKLRATDVVTVTTPAPRPADSSDPGFAERYRALSNGVEPGIYAALAYDAARLLLNASAQNTPPTRETVSAALKSVTLAGLSGPLRFDAGRAWAAPGAWRYLWRAGALVKP